MTLTADSPQYTEQDVRDRISELLEKHPPKETPRTEFLGAQFDLGLSAVWFPAGEGGLGLSPAMQGIVDRELRAAGAPDGATRNPIGVGMGAPTVVAHGTPEQKARWLRPLFSNEEIWCQLFSEPGAGSDVAALATRAVRDGDEWVVNGQKVWTTLAHTAKRGMLVARTDAEQPKHKGMTYFIVDMEAPGVEVRPLRQITGEAEFNEVFFTDARIPEADRLGDIGEGWRISLTTLMNERVSIGGVVAPRGGGPIGEALKIWKAKGHTEAAMKDRLMQLWTAAEVARLTNQRARDMRKAGTPGPEGSVAKLAFAELNQKILEFCVDLMGPEGMLYGSYEMRRPESAGIFGNDIRHSFLRARANSIEGGTSEIMRNILGERVLGLPGEPRTDRDVPWSQVPRSG